MWTDRYPRNPEIEVAVRRVVIAEAHVLLPARSTTRSRCIADGEAAAAAVEVQRCAEHVQRHRDAAGAWQAGAAHSVASPTWPHRRQSCSRRGWMSACVSTRRSMTWCLPMTNCGSTNSMSPLCVRPSRQRDQVRSGESSAAGHPEGAGRADAVGTTYDPLRSARRARSRSSHTLLGRDPAARLQFAENTPCWRRCRTSTRWKHLRSTRGEIGHGSNRRRAQPQRAGAGKKPMFGTSALLGGTC